MTATIYGDPVEITLQALTNAEFQRQVNSKDIKKGLFSVLRGLSSSQRVTSVDKEQETWDTIYSDYRQKLVDLRNREDIGMTDRESLQLRTALMREHTAEDLERGVRDELTIVNAPVVKGDNGVIYITDHAILSNNGINLVNNMHLVEPLEFVHNDNDAFIPRNCVHWEAISAVVEAARAFPVTPRHIVVGVSGPGLDGIDGNAFVANKYVDAETGNLEETPCQLIFLPHRDLIGWINTALTTHNEQDPNCVPVTAEQILANGNVVVVLNAPSQVDAQDGDVDDSADGVSESEDSDA